MTLLLQVEAVRVWFTSNNLTHIWPKKNKTVIHYSQSSPSPCKVRSCGGDVMGSEPGTDLSSPLRGPAETSHWDVGLQRAVRDVCAPEGKTGSRNGQLRELAFAFRLKGENTQRNILGEREGNDPWRGFPWAQCQVVTLRKPSLLQGPLQPSYFTRQI